MRISGLRRPNRSERYPEKTFEIEAVDSATPSINPTTATLPPSVVVRNSGRSEWMASDETSMKKLTSPSAQTVRGMADDRAVTAGGAPAWRKLAH